MIHTVNLTPEMDPNGFEFFKKTVTEIDCYLEYGSGGSTCYAASVANVRSIISVDTSNIWISKVINSIGHCNSKLLLNHCDLGEVGDWGTPISRERSSDFYKYMALPWEIAKVNNLVPGAVLIDGRFRVASFLYSLLCSRVGTIIMFDDYLNRPYYFEVENFCRLEEIHGRMGVFVSNHNYDIRGLVTCIAKFSTVWE